MIKVPKVRMILRQWFSAERINPNHHSKKKKKKKNKPKSEKFSAEGFPSHSGHQEHVLVDKGGEAPWPPRRKIWSRDPKGYPLTTPWVMDPSGVGPILASIQFL